ncbi:Uncharacterised protein [uncultured archaeon]|nr:Uncharacterised protein [uncultured archaeon]
MSAVRYSKVNNFTLSELKLIAEALKNYTFIVHNFDADLIQKTMDVAIKYNISIYAATYVALAINSNSKLYTADEKLITATKLSFVRHIKDFK